MERFLLGVACVSPAGRQGEAMKVYALMLLVSAIITSAQFAGLRKTPKNEKS